MSELTESHKCVLIAKACGWKDNGDGYWTAPDGTFWEYFDVPPAYFTDLNACHEMEEWLFTLGESAADKYTTILRRLVCPSHWIDWKTHHATAAQRAEAFGKTLNLW